MTIENALTHWLSVQNLGKKERTKDFNQGIADTVRRHFVGMDRETEQITPEEIAAFSAKVDGYCPSRWNTILSALKHITPHAKLLKRRKIRFRSFIPPTREQFAKLLNECDQLTRSHAGLAVRLLVLTGLRIGEARGLCWEHVNCEKIFVPPALSKNGMGRSIPFLPGTAETIEKLKAVSPDKVLPRKNFRTALKKACDRAGIKTLSYHCFRHMFATHCIESGVDMLTVARWMGHSDGGALLARMYFHLIDNHSREMANKVKMF